MISFPSLLLSHAQNAGIKTPPNVDDYDATQYSHFYVYECVQLARPIIGESHVRNAEIIAAVPQNKIEKITMRELRKLGVV